MIGLAWIVTTLSVIILGSFSTLTLIHKNQKKVSLRINWNWGIYFATKAFPCLEFVHSC
jgi:hypothetical protein